MCFHLNRTRRLASRVVKAKMCHLVAERPGIPDGGTPSRTESGLGGRTVSNTVPSDWKILPQKSFS